MIGRDALEARLAGTGARLLVLWAGIGLGVAFLATPAKFLAPSLTLPVALDVGRHTFWTYNRLELGLLAILAVVAICSGRKRAWSAALIGPAAIIVVQTLWLLPMLDVRTAAIVAGETPPPSMLHVVYIASEALKILWLLAAGLSGGLERAADPATRFRGGRQVGRSFSGSPWP